MPPRPKRDASYASNRLTRNNFNRPHLLSTYNKPEAKPEKKPEPATDDEPLSSSDEEKEKASNASGSADENKERSSGPTLEEKLAAAKHADGLEEPRSSNSIPRSSGSGSGFGSQNSKGRKRTKDVNYDAPATDDAEEVIFSQSQKRRKATSYGSRRSDTYIKAPSSSSGSESDSKSDSKSKSRSTSNSKKKSNSNAKTRGKSSPKSSKDRSAKSKKGEFKVPVDIKVASPPPKSRPTTEFKQPPPLPNESISSSSFATSSNKDNQLFDYNDDSGMSSPLSSASSGFLQEMSQMADTEQNDQTTVAPEEAVCPMCKKPVDPGSLMVFQAQPKQRIRDQQRFCESHSSGTAKREWNERGYPTIDWDSFEERIERFFPDLEPLLDPATSSSFFRNILEEKLKSGRAKNFRITFEEDSLEAMSCGYYGTHGASKMLQALTGHFSRKLRRLATKDQIANTAGVVGYAQSVLVPELAVRLVKDDMGVTDEAARQILRESIDVGEKLNPAKNDKIPVQLEESNAEGGGA